jgi:hypothetical protein
MGLATDHCVRRTALDAIKPGYRVLLTEDGCRGIDVNPGDIDAAPGGDGSDRRAARDLGGCAALSAPRPSRRGGIGFIVRSCVGDRNRSSAKHHQSVVTSPAARIS